VLDMETLSRLTGIKIPEPEVAVQEPTAAPPVDENAEPVKSGLRVKLLGTLVAADKLWSFASVQDMGTQRSQTYMVGDRIQGAEVTDVQRERVIILNNGRREFIDGQPGDGSTPVPTYTPPPVADARPAGPPNSGLGNGIRSTGENEYEVPRTEIDRTLSNLNEVAMQARIVPAFKDGQAQGFKLFSIRPDSIYSKIGVQNGDVIRRINGFELNSPEKALEVYSKLKEAGRIEIEIERNGAPIRKTYNVR
jgi:general secretion pathway protein C